MFFENNIFFLENIINVQRVPSNTNYIYLLICFKTITYNNQDKMTK